MTYQELKEQISQQGTQCAVNLGMSAATLVVDTESYGYDESTAVASHLAFAFGFSREDVDEGGIIYLDTFMELCELLAQLKLKNELPRIEFMCNGQEEGYFDNYSLASIRLYSNNYSLSWAVNDDIMIVSLSEFAPRP